MELLRNYGVAGVVYVKAQRLVVTFRMEGNMFMDALHPDRQTQTANAAGGTVF
jgi:hypothetical protein